MNTYGRRGMPPEDAESTPTRPRRSLPEQPASIASLPAGAPRRGFVEEQDESPDTRRAWLGVAALGVAIAVVIGALWLIFGGRPETTTTVPAPTLTAGPTHTVVQEPAPSTSATDPATKPTVETIPPITETSPDSPEPTVEAPPSTEVSPTESPDAETTVALDDGAVFTLPAQWELYADELVQDGRRLVRLRELTTDVRIQAVSLTSVTGALNDACLELVADHRQLYSGVAEGMPVDVPITGDGTGVSCNFTGTRLSDSVPVAVEFTMLQRDAVTLVFRDTIPTAVPDDSPARAQLVAMECEAAAGFGVAVDQCALIPGQADG